MIQKIRAAITGVSGYLPDDILDNATLEKIVDTTDEWIRSRTGILERRILREPGKGTSDLGAGAVKLLLEKTGNKAEDIDLLVCATVTPDMQFPATANIICDKTGIKNAFSFDLNAGCSGFVYALVTASKFVETGQCKKVIVVGCEKMSSIVDYTDRATCIIFGDGAGAVLLEPTIENTGIIDSLMSADGSGRIYLHQKAGGSLKPASHKTIDDREHFIYQEGQPVFKVAVVKMAEATEQIMKRNGLTAETLSWLVPHQANLRIIEATARRIGIDKEKTMINIEKYGNTTAATIPLCLWEWERKLKKGDNLVLVAFGAGFTWGSVYLKWAYN
ncbi:MAG TPA: beta-ketoacyl-ACP synthase III [Bacteroidales bacterium]|nr:ketoacyl-ACP synthase III [Bacteroidales bacterium]HNZ43233.1 beta-ketoacyl-ACP synthase III [Bacteroidales bacterium]HOH83151.1 beta-ketoacyl-ACP synthase III [Bacteroidales bacterium]HPB25945.1 beta-ketoacyl-ACP synthase III [Bacteroidales bacterium]HPI30767.1 beta-ketoacyl-ACP synthase III [Bacteroidales bacterium]